MGRNGLEITKVCTGPCGRELPATTKFFHRNRRMKDGLKSKCRDCCNAESKKYRSENRLRLNKQMKDWHTNIKRRVIDHYGGKCACPSCGESNVKFLTIDHINGDGKKHRKDIRTNTVYSWLSANGFPTGFQVLCFNCNSGRAANGGICPHMEKS